MAFWDAPELPGIVGRVHGEVPLPRVGIVRQRIEAPVLPDPGAEAARQAAAVLAAAGRRPGPVAVGVGSRGIANLAEIVAGAIRALRADGWEPFIVPAMGSHGAATAEGQARVLAGYGVDADTMGVPVRATMDTSVVGEVEGLPVHLDRFAAEAGALFLVSRVKPHTDFHGDWESGLAKMAGLGIGKQAGARTMHSAGIHGLRDLAPAAARLLAGRGLLLGGLAVVENQRDQTAEIHGLRADQIGGGDETAVLERARRLMPRLPFEQLDVLVVDAMGKEISGTGLDSNVLNRMRIEGEPEPVGLKITCVAVLELTEASHGNAIGVGLADFVPRRLADQIEVESFYPNVLTSGFVSINRGKLPIVLSDDRETIQAAIAFRGRPAGQPLRLAWIADTLHTEHLGVSEAVWEECSGRPDMEPLQEPLPLEFEPGGRLVPLVERLGAFR